MAGYKAPHDLVHILLVVFSPVNKENICDPRPSWSFVFIVLNNRWAFSGKAFTHPAILGVMDLSKSTSFRCFFSRNTLLHEMKSVYTPLCVSRTFVQTQSVLQDIFLKFHHFQSKPGPFFVSVNLEGTNTWHVQLFSWYWFCWYQDNNICHLWQREVVGYPEEFSKIFSYVHLCKYFGPF